MAQPISLSAYGAFLFDMILATTTRWLAEALRIFLWSTEPSSASASEQGGGLLLDFDARSPLQTLARQWNDRFTYIPGAAKNQLGLTAVLMRPDGFVAWIREDAPNLVEAARATARCFGDPNPEHQTIQIQDRFLIFLAAWRPNAFGGLVSRSASDQNELCAFSLDPIG